MDKSIFQYIWRNSKGQQLTIMAMTVCSFPFLLMALKLPKAIINDAIDGKDFPKDLFDLGLGLGQIEYLLLLCAALFLLIVINIAFSKTINTYKGVSSERMLRRFRYQLYERILRFPQRHFQKVTPSELSAMVTAEVEPLGFFIGESFAVPVVQGGTMITILYFMMSENPILGFVALSMVPIQAWLIPKMQRKVNALGKERVIKARHLAGRVGESCLGVSDVHTNDTSGYMLAELSRRLGVIFAIRVELYEKKFFMKGLNNFLSQLTPLIFYSVGGILIINGELSLGALVAVLAAYARFTTPWRELLKYYQRLQDSRIKYEQLIEQFQPSDMLDPALQQDRPETLPGLKGTIELKNISLVEDGVKALDDVSFKIEPGTRAVIVTDPGSRDKIAHLMSRLILPTTGAIVIGDSNLSTLPESVTGSAIGHIGPESYVFDGTIEDNMMFGLMHAPIGEGDGEPHWDFKEAQASGNTTADVDADWIDVKSLGLADKGELKAWLTKVIYALELDESLAAKSQTMELNPEKHPELAEKLMEVREKITARLNANPDDKDLVYPFKDDQYNSNADIAANMVFGEAVEEEFQTKNLHGNPHILAALEEFDLKAPFLEIGQKFAGTIVDLFGDIGEDQPLPGEFSFLDYETIQKLKNQTIQADREGLDSLDDEERALLISLTFELIVDRHRFGLVDDAMKDKILQARKFFREDLPEEKQAGIAFFAEDTYNPKLSTRRNMLMGTINHTIPHAEERLNDIIFKVLEEMGLTEDMIHLATGAPVGVGGSRLSQADRQKVVLARSLIKKPDIVIFNEALSALDRKTQDRIRGKMFELLPETTFVFVTGEMPENSDFGQILTIRNGRLEGSGEAAPAPEEEGEATNINTEAAVLANIPLFAGIDSSQLKLLAFHSQPMEFKAGENLITQGEQGIAAYVILDGRVKIVLEGDHEIVLAERGENTLLGELSLLSDSVTTATVRAETKVTALEIKKEMFIQLLESDAVVASHVARVISDKLVESLQLLSKAA
ncbi:MAG: cyclic nucleotide-binding domain-containing protein [Proteobacteria bacterium]|nr:cyclic nucleotide-binding domain-containing protein [Pseudomonadota bacterium]